MTMPDIPSFFQRLKSAVFGSGAVAQGDGATAAGQRGVATSGNIEKSTIITGNGNILITLNPGEKDPKILMDAYLRRVVYDTGFFSLEGIDPKAATSGSGGRMNLGGVYTALMTRDASRKETDEAALRAGDPKETGQIPVLDMLDRHDRLVLMGDPGSGKSTFVNFVAMCLAGEMLGDAAVNCGKLTEQLPKDDGTDQEERQPWSHGALLPVRVILRDFAADPCFSEETCANSLWEFIKKYLGDCTLAAFAPLLHQHLLKTGGILLLDGLDEIPEAEGKRARMKQVIEETAAAFPKCRIVLTSRTYAYQSQEWRVPGFHETVLTAFSQGQIVRFIDRWYDQVAVLRNMAQNDAKGKAARLRQAVLGSRRLSGLACRPLLLTLMASLHAWRGGSLPDKREELYDNTVDLLLDWWESNKVIRAPDGTEKLIQPSLTEWLNTDRNDVRNLLNRLAFEAHGKQPELQGTADISEGDLVSGLMALSANPDVKPKRLVEHLSDRAGLLMHRGVRVYSFPHRTFQEYLAACHLTEEGYPETVADLARQAPNRWREVALLAGAKAARGAEFAIWALVDHLCRTAADNPATTEKDLWGAHVAGQAIVETARLKGLSEANMDKKNRMIAWLVRILEGDALPPVERALAGRNLAVLGDPRPEVMTLEGMVFCHVPGGPFIMGEGDEQDESDILPDDFRIGKHPVSNAQYAEFVKSGGYDDGRYWKEAENHEFWRDGKFKGRWDKEFTAGPEDNGMPFTLANHPVVGVSWYEALAFTRWLTEKWRNDNLIGSNHYIRLPSEAEWEKAARGGIRIPETLANLLASQLMATSGNGGKQIENPRIERTFPWGDGDETDRPAPNRANYDKTNLGHTSPLGCFNKGVSPCGCLDMTGNVYEWTRKVCKSYPCRAEDDRENANYGPDDLCALRGGAFDSAEDDLRCAYRSVGSPGWRYGFRVLYATK